MKSKIVCTLTPGYLSDTKFVDLIPGPSNLTTDNIDIVDTETGEILATSLPGEGQRELLAEFCYRYGWLVDFKLAELFDCEKKS